MSCEPILTEDPWSSSCPEGAGGLRGHASCSSPGRDATLTPPRRHRRYLRQGTGGEARRGGLFLVEGGGEGRSEARGGRIRTVPSGCRDPHAGPRRRQRAAGRDRSPFFLPTRGSAPAAAHQAACPCSTGPGSQTPTWPRPLPRGGGGGDGGEGASPPLRAHWSVPKKRETGLCRPHHCPPAGGGADSSFSHWSARARPPLSDIIPSTPPWWSLPSEPYHSSPRLPPWPRDGLAQENRLWCLDCTIVSRGRGGIPPRSRPGRAAPRGGGGPLPPNGAGRRSTPRGGGPALSQLSLACSGAATTDSPLGPAQTSSRSRSRRGLLAPRCSQNGAHAALCTAQPGLIRVHPVPAPIGREGTALFTVIGWHGSQSCYWPMREETLRGGKRRVRPPLPRRSGGVSNHWLLLPSLYSRSPTLSSAWLNLLSVHAAVFSHWVNGTFDSAPASCLSVIGH